MTKKRELFRIAINRTGQIRHGAETVLCKVNDMTEKGFQLQVEGAFRVGEDLRLEFSLTDTCPIVCTVQVTHVRPPFLGARIARISPDQQALLSRFIEQLNALNMPGF
ncbi:MAG TPA: PilZ domain-containing protein [Nitrospira sp.]|nr:PilZ domain-containing protein [Nitrospira sp.]